MKNNHHITPELIRAALAYIPPAMPRDEWVKVGMAIKSEYPDTVGLDLFDAWSQGDGKGYSESDLKATWKSIKPGGPVTIGTLLHMAKERGFTASTDGSAPRLSDAEQAKREQERKARIQAQDEAERAKGITAANNASAIWDGADDAIGSTYLSRKGVKKYGVRVDKKGWLVVPMRDGEGKLWNVQRIAPEPPAEGPDKLFLRGGRKSGLWHLIGKIPSDPPEGRFTLLVTEGYATAASLHEATGHPVAVAFDAGNLVHVAKALRSLHPSALLVICGDDDRETEAAQGKNPGRAKAAEAANKAGGVAVFPRGLPEHRGSDFNDLHQYYGGQGGLDAVRAIIEQAIEEYRTIEATRDTTEAKSGKGATTEQWDRFIASEGGVFYHGVDKEGRPISPEWICSRLDVQAMTRDQDGNGWGYLLAFNDPKGQSKEWAMPARMLSGDGGEYRAVLLNMGLRIATSPRARNLLTQYIQSRNPEELATCTDRVGWHGRAFVLPRETIGEMDERIVFQSEAATENTYRSKGTAEEWRERVSALCAGNSRLVFAVSCAFAGPLLRPAGMESGGFHFRGDSSSGKTTALKVAASVYGGPGYLQRWRATDNALEAIAAQHCDGLLILDELAQVDPKTAGECAYMLANEQSKARATRSGAPRARLSWRLLFLSAGELGLSDHMAEGMKRMRTGQEVRMVDIPADAGKGFGAFEELHEHVGGAEFSRRITANAGAAFGAVGRAWLEYLTEKASTLRDQVKMIADEFERELTPKDASGQVHRVGARFALVAAAGEMATAVGLTDWGEGESVKAARECFQAWIASRGGTGNGEVSAMLRQARRFLEQHGEGRFTWWHRAADDHNSKTLNRAGFRRMLNEHGEPIKTNDDHMKEFGERVLPTQAEKIQVEYFILPEVFKSEVCQGYDHQAMARVLAAHGCLESKEQGRFSEPKRLPGIGITRCYRIKPSIFELDI